jgi:hypothetical protein
VFFIDDVNMPARERYGAQPPIELLRQFQDFRGFYDRKKLFWKDVEDTVLCAACAPPGGGRQEVTPRYAAVEFCFAVVRACRGPWNNISSCVFISNVFARGVICWAGGLSMPVDQIMYLLFLYIVQNMQSMLVL